MNHWTSGSDPSEDVDERRFICEVTHNDPKQNTIRIKHNGSEVRIPRSKIIMLKVGLSGKGEIKIPGWLYRAKFG